MTGYGLKKPCKTCPFVKAHSFPLRPDRIREIADADPFPCHNTVDYGQEDPETGAVRQHRDTEGEHQCFWHLILQWSAYGGFSQLSAFAASLGMFDPEALPTPEESGCYASFEEYATRAEEEGW